MTPIGSLDDRYTVFVHMGHSAGMPRFTCPELGTNVWASIEHMLDDLDLANKGKFTFRGLNGYVANQGAF